MTDYKKMYYELFNAITKAIDVLKEAQVKTEEIFIDDIEPDFVYMAQYDE